MVDKVAPERRMTVSSPFHDADRPDDPCYNPDCTDCWDDDDDDEKPWWWPWAVAGLLAGAAAAGVVIQTGRPGP